MTIHPSFSQQLRREREQRGWSQADLAEKVGCDTKTVGRWESGEGLPRPYHRQALSQILEKSLADLGLVQRTFHSSPQKTGQRAEQSTQVAGDSDDRAPPGLSREEWSEAPYVENLYGRDEECSQLECWIRERRCQVGVILGMGGIGKTAVAAMVVRCIKPAVEFLFWRSLQDAPPFEYFLRQCVSFVSGQHHVDLPETVDDQISLLLASFRNHRCLLVLDNFEAVLLAGRRAGQYRDGYESYGRLLRRVGETQHQSFLLMTSREKPKEVAQLEGERSPVRSFHLSGLSPEAGQRLLKGKELVGSDANWLALVERYSGNPLALQLVSETIREVFAGNIAEFLRQEASVFGDMSILLDQQFRRLSAQEQEVMYWLAVEREATSLASLSEDLVYPPLIGAQLDVLDSLRRRSLIEQRGSSQFTLQPVIMEYVTTNLVERADSEFGMETSDVWGRYAFSKAQAKGYVRESQERLLLAPITQRLLARLGKEEVEKKVRDHLAEQRLSSGGQPGYLAANSLHLLNYAGSDLRGLDFSRLVVRQACLQGVLLPEVNFAHARFISSLFTHTFGNILAVAWSSQEQRFAAGTTLGEIWIYEMPGYTLRSICRGHTDGVWSLAFSPDGSMLVSSSDDQTIRLWDSNSGQCFRTLQGHTNRVRAAAFNFDGTLLASGSDDSTIRLWNGRTGEYLKELPGHSGRVWSVAFHPRENLLASGSTDGTVRLWDLNRTNSVLAFYGHRDWVRSVSFHPRNDMLASGSDDQTVRLWDIRTGEHLKTLQAHTNRVWSVAFRSDGRMLASGSEDQTIRLWEISSGQCELLLRGHARGVRSIAFAPGGPLLASGGDDQTIRVWDSTVGQCWQTLQGYTNRVWSIAFSRDGSVLTSASEDACIRIWDIKTGRCLKTLQDRRHGVMAVACSPDDFRLVSGGQDQTVRVWDSKTGQRLALLRGHTNWVRTVAFSPDGKLLASGSEDQTVLLWDIQTGSCISTLQGHTSWVRSVAFSPDSKLLASGADDQIIRLWDIADGGCLRTLEGHTGRLRSVAFSPDGRLLASGSEDQTIRLWNLCTGDICALLQGHNGWIRSVAFSPDGKLLASGGEDQSIRLWDTDTRQCLQVLQGHSGRVRQVAFSPDGQTVASSNDDGAVKLWDRHTTGCLKTFINERPYERMNITDVQGLTITQKANLEALGAFDESGREGQLFAQYDRG